MAKRRTSQIQRQKRASTSTSERPGAKQRRGIRVDWRLLAVGSIGLLTLIIVAAVLVIGNGRDPYIGEVQPDEGRRHIPVTETPSYASVPATSGPHWDAAGVAPAEWGIYSSPLPEPAAVHNLEHGGIVIWYQRGKLSSSDVDALSAFVRQQTASAEFKFIVSPYGGRAYGHSIAVVAWRWRLYLDSLDLDAIRGFAQAHYGKAPEPLGGPAPPIP